MNCPVCGERLREVEKLGVQVDICPGCKGVRLDRGELEKLLDFAAADGASPEAGPSRAQDRNHDHDLKDRDRDHDHDRREGGERGQGERKRRGSWLGEILGGLGGED